MKHIYFSGIGGSGMSALALLAKQAGYKVSGSDMADSSTIAYLKKRGIGKVHIGQSADQIDEVNKATPIDWFVYTSALPMTDPDHPELKYCQDNAIKATKRDEFLNHIIADKKLKLIAIAGTHGKSTTSAMAVWLFKQLGSPISYCIGAKSDFADSGAFESGSEYFIYEADEFDRSFLNFYPQVSLISGVDWDHPDIYPTRESYEAAFVEFIGQSRYTYLWQDDAQRLGLEAAHDILVLDEKDPQIDQSKLVGHVNRLDAWLVVHGLSKILEKKPAELFETLSAFPGLSRRFEKLADNIYSDYAHTPTKIRGALQIASEVAAQKLVVVYEGLHNLRQHFIKDELAHLFDDVKQLYVVPSYLARENPDQEILTPAKILDLLSNSSRQHAQSAELNDELLQKIKAHSKNGELVLCLSAGGSGSLDEWLRKKLAR